MDTAFYLISDAQLQEFGQRIVEQTIARLAPKKDESGELFTRKDAAAFLKVSQRTICNWISNHTLNEIEVGGVRRIPAAEIERKQTERKYKIRF